MTQWFFNCLAQRVLKTQLSFTGILLPYLYLLSEMFLDHTKKHCFTGNFWMFDMKSYDLNQDIGQVLTVSNSTYDSYNRFWLFWLLQQVLSNPVSNSKDFPISIGTHTPHVHEVAQQPQRTIGIITYKVGWCGSVLLRPPVWQSSCLPASVGSQWFLDRFWAPDLAVSHPAFAASRHGGSEVCSSPVSAECTGASYPFKGNFYWQPAPIALTCLPKASC